MPDGRVMLITGTRKGSASTLPGITSSRATISSVAAGKHPNTNSTATTTFAST